MTRNNFKAPFLKSIVTIPGYEDNHAHPFNIRAFSSGVNIDLTKPVTIVVGENGTGKSTLLNAIATKCGFNLSGGSHNHSFNDFGGRTSRLADVLRLSWLPKVSTGFFMRAENFFNFASYLDQLEKEDPGIVDAYGGKSLHEQSHGESFVSLFKHRFGQRGIYILDEPEAALSPTRQLAFLALVKDLEQTGIAQFIIATHSPILLCYPGATLLSMDGDSIRETTYQETDHYTITKEFLDRPDRYFKHLFSPNNREESQSQPLGHSSTQP